VVAVDGTKVHANASERATCDYEQLAREVLADADAIDADVSLTYTPERILSARRAAWPCRTCAWDRLTEA
jgi:hypothetical protein